MNEVKEFYVRSLIFDAVAQILPTMGRDFGVSLSFIDDNHMNIDVVAMTPMGEAIKGELLANLRPKIFELMIAANKETHNGNESGSSASPTAESPATTPEGNAERSVGQSSDDHSLV